MMNNKGIVVGDKLVAKKPIQRRVGPIDLVISPKGTIFVVKFADYTILTIRTVNTKRVRQFQVHTGNRYYSEKFDEYYEKEKSDE